MNDNNLNNSGQINSFGMSSNNEINSSNTMKSFIPSDEQIEQYNNTLNNDTYDNRPKPPVDLMGNNSTSYYRPQVYAVTKPKSNMFVVISLTTGLLLILGYIVFMLYNTASRKMECTSSIGNITIIYNKKSVTGYKSTTIPYNIYEQREKADSMGIDAYLDEYQKWFTENVGGSCQR